MNFVLNDEIEPDTSTNEIVPDPDIPAAQNLLPEPGDDLVSAAIPATEYEAMTGMSLGVEDNVVDNNDNIDDDSGDTARARVKKKSEKEKMAELMEQAVDSYREGVFDSIRGCAEYYGVTYSTLRKYILHPELRYQGKGKVSTVLTPEEEKQVMELIVERAELGCGMVLCQVQDLIQEIIMAAISVNPLRTSPWADNEESPHYPTERYTRKLLERHKMTLRASMPLHNGRAVLTPEDLDRWQQHTATRILGVYHYNISDQHRLGSELCCVSLSSASLK